MHTAGKSPSVRGLRLLAWAAAMAMETFRSEFPKVVRIETTNHCNARCTFCPRASMDRKKGFMAQELFGKIVAECVGRGVSVLHLHNFGEPLMDIRLPQRIRFAKDRGIASIKIFSNGSLLCNGLAEELLNSGLDEIKISMDGANALEFNRLRKGPDHARIIENVRSFKRAQVSRHNSDLGPDVEQEKDAGNA
jgi:MoaA/NifB/PqqE/SkfB family radical SAM enzyme